ncbi:MAG: hypothetical protein LAO76_26960 [Acidobacteriia bacterium]|nr:hypothetical protein [Terriglobia bacterium]
MTDLRRTLWRYQARQIRYDAVALAFEEEISLILEGYRATIFQIGEVRGGSREFQLCVTLDNAINSARAHVRGRNFKAALRELKRAEASRKVLGLSHAARALIQRAEGLCGKLSEALGPGAAQSFMAYETARRLLAAARQLYDKGELRPSRFVAGMCQLEVERLLRIQEADEGEMRARRMQIANLRALQDALAQLPFRNEDDLITTTVSRAELLMAEGHMLLAKCTLDELEPAVAPRAAFLEELTRQLGPSSLKNKGPMLCLLEECGISAQDTWESATGRLLEHALARLEAKLNALARIVSEQARDLNAVSV